MRGFPKGGAPLCVVADEGVTGEKPHRKGFSLVCPFGDFSDKGKVTQGPGRGAPGAIDQNSTSTEK